MGIVYSANKPEVPFCRVDPTQPPPTPAQLRGWVDELTYMEKRRFMTEYVSYFEINYSQNSNNHTTSSAAADHFPSSRISSTTAAASTSINHNPNANNTYSTVHSYINSNDHSNNHNSDSNNTQTDAFHSSQHPSSSCSSSSAHRSHSQRLSQENFLPEIPPPPPQPSQSTARFSDFKPIRTLGVGSFGRVLLCKDLRAKTSSNPDFDESSNSIGGYSSAGHRYYAVKVMQKGQLVSSKQVAHTRNERGILSCISFPFIVCLLESFKDFGYLYMVLEYVPGGELFSLLANEQRFNEENARFFAAQVVCAFTYLHSMGVVYRDLKPENMLIDTRGYVKITDFGFAKMIAGLPDSENRTWTLCGTPEYLAPEVIMSRGYGFSVDWWALGILIYEMCRGRPPFMSVAGNHMETYEQILKGHYDIPQRFSLPLQDLIQNLLRKDLTQRFGYMKNGVWDIIEHPWFTGTVTEQQMHSMASRQHHFNACGIDIRKHLLPPFDFVGCLNRTLRAPYPFPVAGPEDTRYFDEYDEQAFRVFDSEQFEEQFSWF
eukprot:Nk52_evm25s147 gene=Nk52_evmTU25s147